MNGKLGMKHRWMTTEGLAVIEAEADRRARGLPPEQRRSTKEIAKQIGNAYGYVANLISKRRRELEKKVDIGAAATADVNSEASTRD